MLLVISDRYVFLFRGGSAFDKKEGVVTLKWRHISRSSETTYRGNVLDFGSLKLNFQHFEVIFEQNRKVSNQIINSVSHNILKKY